MNEKDERALIELARVALWLAFTPTNDDAKEGLIKEAECFGISSLEDANDFLERVDP